MKTMNWIGLGLVFFVAGLAAAEVVPLPVANPSFETPVIEEPATSFDLTDAYGWTRLGGNVATIKLKTGMDPSVYAFAQEGNQFLFLGDRYNSVWQTINSQKIYVGDQYTMTGYVSRASFHQNGMQYQVVFYTATAPNLAPGAEGTEIVKSINANDFFPGYGPNWTQWVIQWTAQDKDRNKYLGIQLKNNFWADASGYEHIYFDNIVLGVEKGSNVPSDCAQAIAWGYTLPMDFSGNCIVDLADLAIFAADWLECIIPGNPSCDQPWLEE